MSEVVVYGASWCPDCRRSKDFLISQRVPFTWIDLEEHPEAVAEVESRNAGKRIIPTILFPDGGHLAEPSNEELAARLGLAREAREREYDLVVVGGGPTGLTAALYGARENQRVLVVERSAPGGQAGITERLDNYPGFPDGVAGAELAERITRQVERYGVEILSAVAVESLGVEGGLVEVDLSTGSRVAGRAALIATGSTYRRTGARGEAELIGAGVHFCATCDGPFYRGADQLVVVGGGNSGLEEGLFLTQFAARVTVVQAGPRLSASALLQDKVRAHPRMEVLTSTSVEAFETGPDGKLQALTLVGEHAGRLETPGAFLFVGLDPNTGFLGGQLDLDPRGFLLTDECLRTSMPGVFAAGDVRAGSTKQLASAVGEGAAVALHIRQHLEESAASVGAPARREEL